MLLLAHAMPNPTSSNLCCPVYRLVLRSCKVLFSINGNPFSINGTPFLINKNLFPINGNQCSFHLKTSPFYLEMDTFINLLETNIDMLCPKKWFIKLFHLLGFDCWDIFLKTFLQFIANRVPIEISRLDYIFHFGRSLFSGVHVTLYVTTGSSISNTKLFKNEKLTFIKKKFPLVAN